VEKTKHTRGVPLTGALERYLFPRLGCEEMVLHIKKKRAAPSLIAPEPHKKKKRAV